MGAARPGPMCGSMPPGIVLDGSSKRRIGVRRRHRAAAAAPGRRGRTEPRPAAALRRRRRAAAEAGPPATQASPPEPVRGGPSTCSTPAPPASSNSDGHPEPTERPRQPTRCRAMASIGASVATRVCAGAIARATAAPAATGSRCHGLVGSNFGQFSGGSFGIVVHHRRQIGARRRRSLCGVPPVLLQRAVQVGLALRRRNAAAPSRVACTSTSGVMPSPWIERPDGV